MCGADMPCAEHTKQPQACKQECKACWNIEGHSEFCRCDCHEPQAKETIVSCTHGPLSEEEKKRVKEGMTNQELIDKLADKTPSFGCHIKYCRENEEHGWYSIDKGEDVRITNNP